MKMKTNNPTQAERRWDAAALDELIDEFTVEAAGDDERVLAFLQALEKHVPLPCDGFVIGEPVSVVKFDYQGNQRRGLPVAPVRSRGSGSPVPIRNDPLATLRKCFGQRQVGE
jgi:hypothetical protein